MNVVDLLKPGLIFYHLRGRNKGQARLSIECIFVSMALLPIESVLCNGSFGYMNHAQYISVQAEQVQSMSDKTILQKIDSVVFVILFL